MSPLELKAWLEDIKRSTPCAECGARFPHYVMQFDHVRGAKRFDLALAGLFGIGGNSGNTVLRDSAGEIRPATEADVRTELEKCDVVCSNCHTIRGHRRRQRRKRALVLR